jgi:hypothetical protein
MSADKRTSVRFARVAVLWGLMGTGGLVIADDAEAPDLEFLEYLGSWEESDEDWVLLAADAAVKKESEEQEEEVDTAPNGEKLAELDDE